ncbi:MAG: hypothetical protein ACI4XJ_08880 [Eubacteriales bacterium]
MKKFLPAVLLLCLIIMLPSCGEGKTRQENKKIDGYITQDASFTLTFPPTYDGGECVAADCVRTASSVTLELTSPQRSAGITVKLDLPSGTSSLVFSDGVNGVSGVNGVNVPMSAEASAGLSEVFRALFPQSYTIAASEDGENRLILSDSGSSLVDKTGSPVRIICGSREIAVSSFAAK